MKMDVHNEQGEVVELEVRLPKSTVYGSWVFDFAFPDGRVAVVVMDKYEMKALLSVLVGSL